MKNINNNFNILNEQQMLRDESKKRWQKLYKDIQKQGGDIGDKVRKDQKTKEDKEPNCYYMNNPWDGKRHVDTYESFCLKESIKATSLEDMYKNKDVNGIDLNDDSWIKGTKEDKERPMFNNHPDKVDRYPMEIGINKFITIDGVTGQINSIKNKVIILDIINDENKHEYKEYNLATVLKKLKNKEDVVIKNKKGGI